MDAVEELKMDIQMSLEAWQRGEATFDETVADLLALARSNSWQDIETAPKDKGAILGFMWIGDHPVTRVLHWDEEDGWHSNGRDYRPTHWQPLPEAPK